MTNTEKNKYISAGVDDIDFYINEIKNREAGHTLYEKDRQIKVEIDMKNEGCFIDNAELGGKIDKVIFDNNNLLVIDLKTGKGFDSWDKAKTNSEKIKLHFYKYQLAYYHILLKKSKNYNNFNVKSLHLEFVEKDNNNKINILSIDSDNPEFKELVNRVESLIKIVYNKIINLDFPDINKYMIDKNNNQISDMDKVTLDNILQFEDDLLKNKI